MSTNVQRGSRVLLAGIALAAAALCLVQVATAGPPPQNVPDSIQVPAGNKVFLIGHGVGVQIYSCTATATGFAWSFVAPRANLFADNGKLVTTHFGGPTWQAKDGSQVVGKLDAPPLIVDTSAVPWLRLSAASTTAGAGGSELVKTSFIQRLNTVGGVAPLASTCTAANAGAVQEVPYTADYYFWTQKGHD
jgi:hypothetical protein